MIFYTPRKNQGQIVEISYAYDYKGGAYRRVTDKSDQCVSYEHGILSEDEPEDYDYDRAPLVTAWIPCHEPK